MFKTIFLSFFFTVICFSKSVVAEVIISNSSIKVSGGMGKAAAVFMTIVNDTDGPDRLISVRTLDFKKAMLHDTITSTDGVVKMKHLMMGIKFSKGEEVTLASGGKHLMLMGPNKPILTGDSLKIWLNFESFGEIETTLIVQ
jgi:periplasmic copper chaperone A